MTAPLSIVIPTLNAEVPLRTLLPQLVDGLMSGLITEVIFADGGSTDATAQIAEETGANVVTTPKGRGVQLKAGAEAAKGSWLFFLHADSSLPADWVATVEAHMNTKPDRAAAFRLAFDDAAIMAKVTATWANMRSRYVQLPYGDQGLLIPAPLYRKIGGFDAVPLMEDVAIAKRLKGRIDLLPTAITTSADKYRRDGWIKRGTRNLHTLFKYKMGHAPEKLIETYDRKDHSS